jgi:transitional endoplasmic reticulum ATPase
MLARKLGHSFFSLLPAEVYTPFVGEAEATIRSVFDRARMSSPAIVFLDELDALVGSRELSDATSNNDVTQDRILSTLLNEIDGVDTQAGDNEKRLLLIGSTNFPDRIDPALLRAGRLDRFIYVPAPDARARSKVLEACAKCIPCAKDINWEECASNVRPLLPSLYQKP